MPAHKKQFSKGFIRAPYFGAGFTLIELLVTISIIAILSAVGIVSFIGIRNRALDAKIKGDIDAIRKAYEQNFDPTENGGQGGYKQLNPAQFADGKIPTQPNNSPYPCPIGPGCAFSENQGYLVTATLSDGTTYKAISNQGTYPQEQLNSCDPSGSLSNGLVGYWKMDDDAISNGSTIAGYNNSFPGTVEYGAGGMSSVYSKSGFNKAVKGTGVVLGNKDGNRIYLGTLDPTDHLSQFKTKQFTISALIKRDSGDCGTWKTCDIFSAISGIGGVQGFALRLVDANRLRLSVTNDGWRITTSNSISHDSWHHVAAVLNVGPPLEAKLYVDGVSQTPRTGEKITPAPTLNYTGTENQPVLIGNGYGDFITPFSGSIDDVAFYNRVLSDNEIQTLANRTFSCP